MTSRRRFLALGVATALGGCTTMADDPPKSGTNQSTDPDRHIYGADGEWSSFGCNASNTRTVGDGKAPVDGVSEKWRVEAFQIMHREPLVADGRVFVPALSALVVYDASDGSELWQKSRESGIDTRATPLVRDETVFVGGHDELFALDVETGETRWKQTFDGKGSVRTPGMYDSDWLYVPTGETVHRVSSATGKIEWSRQLFGEILGSPAILMGHYVALTTEAGKLYLLEPDGTGAGEWNFPAKPKAPPTADADGVYVNCMDGKIYGIALENSPQLNVDWTAKVGWANGGLAVKKHVYAAGNGLHAVNPDDGELVWKHDTGDWRWTAPALGRDTLFVGGDKLYAFDPTPSLRVPGTGPAKRFEKSFHGRVGPGPVLNDGTLYVVAQTAKQKFHLLALE